LIAKAYSKAAELLGSDLAVKVLRRLRESVDQEATALQRTSQLDIDRLVNDAKSEYVTAVYLSDWQEIGDPDDHVMGLSETATDHLEGAGAHVCLNEPEADYWCL
jgi:hypothetical protein